MRFGPQQGENECLGEDLRHDFAKLLEGFRFLDVLGDIFEDLFGVLVVILEILGVFLRDVLVGLRGGGHAIESLDPSLDLR